MSLGRGGLAKVVAQDADTVIYEYYTYDLNHEGYENSDKIYDGIITINKNSFVEPEIHEKIKKLPGGRKKLVTKRIPRDVDYSMLIEAGQISVKNSKFCYYILDNGIGKSAMTLINKIFESYQIKGVIPETAGYIV